MKGWPQRKNNAAAPLCEPHLPPSFWEKGRKAGPLSFRKIVLNVFGLAAIRPLKRRGGNGRN